MDGKENIGPVKFTREMCNVKLTPQFILFISCIYIKKENALPPETIFMKDNNYSLPQTRELHQLAHYSGNSETEDSVVNIAGSQTLLMTV